MYLNVFWSFKSENNFLAVGLSVSLCGWVCPSFAQFTGKKPIQIYYSIYALYVVVTGNIL